MNYSTFVDCYVSQEVINLSDDNDDDVDDENEGSINIILC